MTWTSSGRLAERIVPGRTGTATVTFESSGVHTVFCDIDNHRSLGHLARFTVVDA